MVNKARKVLSDRGLLSIVPDLSSKWYNLDFVLIGLGKRLSQGNFNCSQERSFFKKIGVKYQETSKCFTESIV